MIEPVAAGGPLVDFAVAFGLVFLAELGDKSMLLALGFATRYRAGVVFAGIVVASLVSNGLATLAGAALGAAFPARTVALVSGVLFLAFAVWMLRDDDDDDREAQLRTRSVLLGVTLAFLVAEIGDKTTLAAAVLATSQQALPTWLGAAAGMSAASGIAIVVGAVLGQRLPQRATRIVAVVAFVVFGVLLILDGLVGS